MPKDLNSLELQRSANLTSCAAGKPLITFGGGDAPVLDYRMPQSTSFDTFSPVSLVVNQNCWSNKALNQYPNPYANLTTSAIANLVTENSAQIVGANQQIGDVLSAAVLHADVLIGGNSDGNDIIQPNPMSDDILVGTSNNNIIVPPPAGTVVSAPTAIPIQTVAPSAAVSDNFYQLLKKGYTPRLLKRFSGVENTLILEKRPTTATPVLFIIHQYRTKSFLGNYGAGQTISTFSLLPGEKTSIVVKSFKEISSLKTSASNIVDSFSKESADEMENLLEAETSTSQTDSSAASQTTNRTKSFTAEAHFDVSASFKIMKQGGTASAGGSMSGTNTSGRINTISTNATSAQNAKDLHKALEKHVNKSNANRTHSIQQNDTSSSKETFENTTTRELVNPNIGRVLNFVFRNLNQGYKVLTSLEDIKIGFVNGYPESEMMVDISQLDVLLNEVIKNDTAGEKSKQDIRDFILCQYGKVTDYSGEERDFIESYTDKKPLSCGNKTYFRKKPKLQYFYNTVTDETLDKEEANADLQKGMLKLSMNGVILKADEFVLKTDAVIIDALLGQASALDCFNANVQEEKKNELVLNNIKQELAFETLKQITDPIKRAEMFAEIFNPRQTIIRD